MLKKIFLLFFIILSLKSNAQKNNDFVNNLKGFDFEFIPQLNDECSSFSTAEISVTKKGLIDSVHILNNDQSLFSKCLLAAFDKMRTNKVKVGKKKIVIFFIYINANKVCDGGFYNKLLDNAGTGELNFRTKADCIYIGPVTIRSAIKEKPKHFIR